MATNGLNENDSIYDYIYQERLAQDAKWGKQKHSRGIWLAILVEEVGEVAKAILEHDPEQIFPELVQVAAVCVNWLEAMRDNRSTDDS